MNPSSSLRRNKRTLGILLAVAVLSLVLLLLAGCNSSPSAKELYETKCSTCHSLDTVTNANIQGEEQWKSVVDRMKAMSSTISDDDADKITAYLAG